MHPLSLKIIPPFQVLILGFVMWCIHRLVGLFHFHSGYEYIASRALLYLCLCLFCLTIYQFWRHKTTVNPSKLQDTRSLITNGVFAFSRNPVYVIDALLLLAWAVWLGQWLNLAMPLVFVWYCTEFQIKAEEKVLAEKFGSQYEQYKKQVRRWL